jgi:hypothetical protein
MINSTNLPRDARVIFVARPLLTPVAQKLCSCKYGVFTSRKFISFILEHSFASTSFAGAHEAFGNGYPDKEVQNKKTIHRLATKFRDIASVCDRKHVRRRTVLAGETLRDVEEALE